VNVPLAPEPFRGAIVATSTPATNVAVMVFGPFIRIVIGFVEPVAAPLQVVNTPPSTGVAVN
jgi:hypothetical protein